MESCSKPCNLKPEYFFHSFSGRGGPQLWAEFGVAFGAVKDGSPGFDEGIDSVRWGFYPQSLIPGQRSIGSLERMTCMPALANRRKAALAGSL